MAHNALINGTNYSIKGGNSLINGTGYKVSGGGVLINGTRQNIAFGTPLNNLSVGSSVYMNVGGVRTEFLIVHKGNPDASQYDSSCDGIWLLSKKCHGPSAWGSTNYEMIQYADSYIPSYLNNILYQFDTNIRNIIKQVKIPYQVGIGAVQTLTNGLSTKLFILNCKEIGWYNSSDVNFGGGAKLSYFDLSNFDSDKRYCEPLTETMVDGSVVYQDSYWTRTTIYYKTYIEPYYVYSNSSYKGLLGASREQRSLRGIRYSLILPYNITVDDNMNIIA